MDAPVLHADEARVAIVHPMGKDELVSFPRPWHHPCGRPNVVRGVVDQTFGEDGISVTFRAIVTARRTRSGRIDLKWRYL